MYLMLPVAVVPLLRGLQTLVPPTEEDEENVVALQRKYAERPWSSHLVRYFTSHCVLCLGCGVSDRHMSPWYVALSPDQTKLAILQVAYVLIIERNGSLADGSTTAVRECSRFP